MSNYQRGLLYAFSTGFNWALLAIALKVALKYADSGTIAWFRMLVAFLFLTFYFALKRPQEFKVLKALPLALIIAGLCLAVNYFGYMKGIELTSASHTQIMIQLAPFSLAVVGVFYFKETPTRAQVLGFFCALVGFALFYADQFDLNLSNSKQFLEGNLWLVLAAATWVVFAVLQKKLSLSWTSHQINFVIYLISTLSLVFISDLGQIPQWSFWVWILMIACGLNTVVAYGCLSEALKRIPASHVSLVLSTNPLLTLALIYLLTYFEVSWLSPEPVHFRGYLGAAFVVGGLILTLKKQSIRKSKPMGSI